MEGGDSSELCSRAAALFSVHIQRTHLACSFNALI